MNLKLVLKSSLLGLFRRKEFYTCLLCLGFIVYNSLHLLQKALDRVVYDSNYEKLRRMPFVTACLAIDARAYDCDRLQNIADYRKCRELRKLFDYIENNEIAKSPQQILERVDTLNVGDFITFLPEIKYKLSESFLNYNHLCFKYKFADSVISPRRSVLFAPVKKGILQNTFKLSYSVFFHDEENPVEFNRYLATCTCSQFDSCAVQALNLEKYEFKLLPYPYSTDCLNYQKQKFAFQSTIEIRTQLECLVECAKAHFRSSYFFYKSGDTKDYLFIRNLTEREKDFKHSPAFRDCLKVCAQPDCVSTRYFVKSIDNLKSNNLKSNNNLLIFNSYPFLVSIEARPFIKRFELIVTLLGFLSLIFSLDALLLSIKTSKLLATKFGHHPGASKAASVLSWSFLTFLICISISQSVKLSGDYLNNETKFRYKIYYLSEPDTNFNLHLCYPLSRMIRNSPFLMRPAYDESKELAYVKKYLDNTKLGELLEQTYNASDSIEKIRFNFGLKKVAISLGANEPKNVFFKWHPILERDYMPQKCFTVEIKLKYYHFENLFKSTRIVVTSKSDFSSYYLTDPDRTITSEDDPLIGYRETIKKVVMRHPEECTNHKQQYGCSSYWDCLDRCVFDRLLQENKVHMYFFRLENFSNLSNHLNRSLVYKDDVEAMKKDCRKIYPKFDCRTSYYENEKTHVEHTDLPNLRIFPSFFTTTVIQQEYTARCNDYLLVLLNLVVVLLGVNAPSLYKLTTKLLGPRLSSGCLNSKIDLVVKVLFCVLFVLHVRLIFENTFSVDLRNGLTIGVKTKLSEHDELSEINLCFDFKLEKKISTLNGFVLDKLTKEISLEQVVSSMIYLNQKGEEQVWLPTQTSEGNPFFKFDHFYFLNKKCLNIVNYFAAFSTSHKHFLKIVLNRNFSHEFFYICSNPIGKKTLSKLNRLSMRDQFYEIYLDRLHLDHFDVFEEFRNPFLLYKRVNYKDLEEFVPMLRRAFLREHNATTRWLPLIRDLFGYPIRDDLFNEFYKNFQSQQSKFFSDNFNLMMFRDNILIEKSLQQTYNLKFNSEHFKISNEMGRRESFLSFLVSLLNSISFWFALSLSQAIDRVLELLFSLYRNRVHPLLFDERPVNNQ